jgi:DNA-binding transcriptional ArsR family regulator
VAAKTTRNPRIDGMSAENIAAKAFSHPLRTRLLLELVQRQASPNELARQVGEPLGNVSYHVLALKQLGMIELVDTAQRRGAIEHYYQATTLDDGTRAKLVALRDALDFVLDPPQGD